MKLTTIKSLVAIALVAVEMSAIAVPMVTVDKVLPTTSWSKIKVNYTISGTDANKYYNVVFNIMAGSRIIRVENGVAKLSNGEASKEFDTVKLFNGEVIDEQAKVEVSLAEITLDDKDGVQLWEGGPFWAEFNVGASMPDPGDHYSGGNLFGNYYAFGDAAAAVTKNLGEGWRVPTMAEFETLFSGCTRSLCDFTDSEGRTYADKFGCTIKGYRFTSKSDPSKSIFLPAGSGRYEGLSDNLIPYGGNDGFYWSSDRNAGNSGLSFDFHEYGYYKHDTQPSFRESVRAVRDLVVLKAETIDSDEEEFELAPPSVTINEVTEEGSLLTVSYTIGGTDEESGYGVAFDLTMDEQTARVTDSSRNFLKGTYTKTLNLTELFGGEVAAEQAKIKVSLIMRRFKDQGGVQLWEDGPFWAECNVGGQLPADYGEYLTKAQAERTMNEIEGWRLPTNNEFTRLDTCERKYATSTDRNGTEIAGQLFEGTDGSIFIPAAGYAMYGSAVQNIGMYGGCWSMDSGTYSTYSGDMPADYCYYFIVADGSVLMSRIQSFPGSYYVFSVRAVRDATVVDTDELGWMMVEIVPNAAEPTIVKTIKVENSFLNAIVIAGNPDATPADKLYAMGANGIVNWQNAILRLSPTVATDKPYLNAVANSAVGSSTLKLFHGTAGEPLSPRSNLGISVKCKVVAANNPAFTGTTIEWNCADDGSVTVELPTPSIGNSEVRYFKPELIFE